MLFNELAVTYIMDNFQSTKFYSLIVDQIFEISLK